MSPKREKTSPGRMALIILLMVMLALGIADGIALIFTDDASMITKERSTECPSELSSEESEEDRGTVYSPSHTAATEGSAERTTVSRAEKKTAGHSTAVLTEMTEAEPEVTPGTTSAEETASVPETVTEPAANTTAAVTTMAAPEPTTSAEGGGIDEVLKEYGESIYEETARRGTDGRVLIPAVDIDTALKILENNSTAAERQAAVDEEDMAAVFPMYAATDCYTYMIADHNSHGFGKISGIRVGDEAYIVTPGATYKYQCVLYTTGVNTGSILMSDGRNAAAVYPMSDWRDGFVLYTCRQATGEDIYIAVFRAVD